MMNQTDWIKADHGNVCVITNKGNIVLEPQVDVDTLYYPSYGMCQVEKDGKYGYIDESGELVIPFQYKKAFPFSENGLAFVVGDGGLGGYIDIYGEFIIEPIYETGSTFKFGFAAVSKNGEYKYIYKNGLKAIDNTFKYASGFADCGLAKVVTFNGKQSLMDTTSRVILQLKEGCELTEFKGDSRITKFRTNGREALINAAGEIFTGFFEQVVISPYSHLNPFLRNGLWGYVDDRGNEVIPNIYKEVTQFTEDNVAKVKAFHPLAENQLWEFYINEKDEIIDDKIIERKKQFHSERFIHVNRFKKSLALAVKKEGETIRASGKEIVAMDEATHVGGSITNSETIEYDDENEDGLIEDCQTIEYEDEYDADIMLFEVEIYFHNKDEKGILEFIRDELGWNNKISGLGNNYVKLLWLIVSDWDPADIENAMYYALNDGELGTYNYRQIY